MKNNIIKNLFKNYECRVYFTSSISLIFTIAFLVYNFYLGIKFKLTWNFSISIYYLLLIIIRMIILINEKKWKAISKKNLLQKRISLYKVENIFLIIIDVALIVPIILMVLQKRSVNVGMIPAIAIAAYTTYKVIMACVSYNKTKKLNNITLHGLKILNLKEAIVSILTLQNILIMTFSEGVSMIQLTSYTSFGMLLSLIILSVYQIYKISRI